jgi:hypothetical protein
MRLLKNSQSSPVDPEVSRCQTFPYWEFIAQLVLGRVSPLGVANKSRFSRAVILKRKKNSAVCSGAGARSAVSVDSCTLFRLARFYYLRATSNI